MPIIRRPLTNEERFNFIVKDAIIINSHLSTIRSMCVELLEEIDGYSICFTGEKYEALKQLEATLEELANFDLEDSIPEEETI